MFKKLVINTIYLAVIIIIWEFIFYYKLISPAIIASPFEVFVGLKDFLIRQKYFNDLLSTFLKSLIAFLYSVPIGLSIGYILHISKSLKNSNVFYFDFIRSIPVTALIPFFFIAFGIGSSAQIGAGTFGSTLSIALATYIGFDNTSSTRLDLVKIYNLNWFKTLILVKIPEAASEIFIGLRTGISLSLILVIVGEMFIGSNDGLGKVINDMRYIDTKYLLYAAILWSGFIGFFFNKVLSFFEKLIIHWKDAK